MKQLFLLFLILLSGMGVDGQKIRFTDTSNVWYERFSDEHKFGMTKVQITYDTMINNIVYYRLPGLGFVREDTVTKTVVRITNSGEMIVYDFSLEAGDTLYYPYTKEHHFVQYIDSVQIDSFWYKVFYFEIIEVIHGTPSKYYSVIENIGCTEGLNLPWLPYRAERGGYWLNCFYNNGRKPKFNKTIQVGHTNFDNTDTCYVFSQNVSVNDIPDLQQPIAIFPHPANATSVISLPYTLQSGELTIYNTMGQTIRQVSFSNTAKVSIGQLPNAGMYYYRINDKSNGQLWQGKLVYSF